MRRADSFLSDAASGGEGEEVLFGAPEIFFFCFLGNIRRVHELGLVDLNLDQKKGSPALMGWHLKQFRPKETDISSPMRGHRRRGRRRRGERRGLMSIESVGAAW